MRCLVMFIALVCLIFLLTLKWPKNKNDIPNYDADLHINDAAMVQSLDPCLPIPISDQGS